MLYRQLLTGTCAQPLMFLVWLRKWGVALPHLNGSYRVEFTAALGGGFNGSMQHCSQSIGRCFKAQGLPGTLVEAHGDAV
jgi:hypothetical protein